MKSPLDCSREASLARKRALIRALIEQTGRAEAAAGIRESTRFQQRQAEVIPFEARGAIDPAGAAAAKRAEIIPFPTPEACQQ